MKTLYQHKIESGILCVIESLSLVGEVFASEEDAVADAVRTMGKSDYDLYQIEEVLEKTKTSNLR